MREWQTTTIGAVASIFDGPHATPRTVDDGPVFLGISALRKGRLDLTDTRHVTPEDFVTWTRRVRPQADDVVFSYETRIGEAAIIPEGLDCCLGRRMGLVRVDRSALDPWFFLFFYLAPPFQEFLRSRTIPGATVDRIALKEFPSFPIAVPPLADQQRIVSVLRTIDDKIELNRQTNRTLEATARAIFKDWFVDFGPTSAKMEGRVPYLAPDIWELFPDRLDEDGKPTTWRKGRLRDVLELVYGKALPARDRVNGSVPVYGSGGFSGWHNEALVDGRTIIVGRKGTVGSIYWESRASYPIDTVFYVRSEHPMTYCLHLLESLGLETMNTDAAVPGLNRENAYRLDVTFDEPATFAFEALVSPMRDRMDANLRENETLAATRDLLLPKLMSGELRIRDAETIVAAAA